METVKYISHKFINDVDNIKALALYFDEIDIVEQSYVHIFDNPNANLREEIDEDGKKRYFKSHSAINTTEFTGFEFKQHIQPFVDAKTVVFSNDFGEIVDYPREIYAPHQIPIVPVKNTELILPDDYLLPKNENRDLYFINNEKINTLIKSHLNNSLTVQNEIELLKDEINRQKFFKRMAIQNRETKLIATSDTLESVLDEYRNEHFYFHCYIGKLFQSFMDNLNAGRNTITTSQFLNELMKQVSNENGFKNIKEQFKNELQVNPFLVNEAIKLAVPNLSKFPTEEILEFKHKSNDELLAFRTKMNELAFDLKDNYDAEFIAINAQKIADIKIKPLLEEISQKLGDSKLTVLRSLLQEARDPKSYSPLLLTLSNNISSTLTLLVSLGIIGINTAVEYYSKVKDAKRDGIYYLLKAKQYFA